MHNLSKKDNDIANTRDQDVKGREREAWGLCSPIVSQAISCEWPRLGLVPILVHLTLLNRLANLIPL